MSAPNSRGFFTLHELDGLPAMSSSDSKVNVLGKNFSVKLFLNTIGFFSHTVSKNSVQLLPRAGMPVQRSIMTL